MSISPISWINKLNSLVLVPIGPVQDVNSPEAQELFDEIVEDVNQGDAAFVAEILGRMGLTRGVLAQNFSRRDQQALFADIQNVVNRRTCEVGLPEVVRRPTRFDLQGKALRCIDGKEQEVSLDTFTQSDYNDVQISADGSTMVAAGGGRRVRADIPTDSLDPQRDRKCAETFVSRRENETLEGIQIYSRAICNKNATCSSQPSDRVPEWRLTQSALIDATITHVHVSSDGSGIVAYDLYDNILYILRNTACSGSSTKPVWSLMQKIALEQRPFQQYAICAGMHASESQSHIVVTNKNLDTNTVKTYVLTNAASCEQVNGLLNKTITSQNKYSIVQEILDQDVYYQQVTVSRDGQTMLLEFGSGEPTVGDEPPNSNIEFGYLGMRIFHWQPISEESCKCEYVLRQTINYENVPTGFSGREVCTDNVEILGGTQSTSYRLSFLTAGGTSIVNVPTNTDTSNFTPQDIADFIFNTVGIFFTVSDDGQLCYQQVFPFDSDPNGLPFTLRENFTDQVTRSTDFSITAPTYDSCTRGRTVHLHFAGLNDNRIIRLVDRATERVGRIFDPSAQAWQLGQAETPLLQVFDRPDKQVDICGKEVQSCRESIVNASAGTCLKRGVFEEFVRKPTQILKGCVFLNERTEMLYTHRINKHIFMTWCDSEKEFQVYCETDVDNEWIRVPPAKFPYSWLVTTSGAESQAFRGYMALPQDANCEVQKTICMPVARRKLGKFIFRTISTDALTGSVGFFNGNTNPVVDLGNNKYYLPDSSFVVSQLDMPARPFLANFPCTKPADSLVPPLGDPMEKFTRDGNVNELPGAPAIPPTIPFPLEFNVWQRWPVDQPGYPTCRTGYFKLSKVDPFLNIGCNIDVEFVLTPKYYMFDPTSPEDEPNPNVDERWIFSRSTTLAYMGLFSVCFDLQCAEKDCRCKSDQFPFFYHTQPLGDFTCEIPM